MKISHFLQLHNSYHHKKDQNIIILVWKKQQQNNYYIVIGQQGHANRKDCHIHVCITLF
jgi:hypothetical protein